MAQQEKRHGITLPTSTIQGREFFWVVVDAGVDLQTDYDVIGSNFQKLVTALQQVAEMHVIGNPGGEFVTIALSMNTTPGAGPFDSTTISELEDVIEGSTGWNVTVYDAEIRSDDVNYD